MLGLLGHCFLVCRAFPRAIFLEEGLNHFLLPLGCEGVMNKGSVELETQAKQKPNLVKPKFLS